jgi:hypothetical protein
MHGIAPPAEPQSLGLTSKRESTGEQHDLHGTTQFSRNSTIFKEQHDPDAASRQTERLFRKSA